MAMMVGYPPNHASGVYRMLNLETFRIVTTRDVKWINKTWGEYMKDKEGTDNDEERSEVSSLKI